MSNPLRPVNSRRGYLLLEVVLALSIFIVAVVGVLSCLNAGLDADYEQRRLTNMRLNLQSLFDESLVMVAAKGSTNFAEDAYHIRYHREVTDADFKLKNKKLEGMLKISVQALDARRDNKVIGELWTYVSP